MKLRVYESSLRFRLTQEEADQLYSGHIVESKVQFSSQSALRFAIEPCENEMSAKLLHDEIVVQIGTTECERLSRDKLGVSFVANDGKLRVVIEKDLDCKH